MAGIMDKLKGRFKEGYGDATGDDKLRTEGKLDRFSGDVKDKTDSMVDGANDAAKDAGDKLDDLRRRRM